MNWLKNLLQEAGLGHLSWLKLLGFAIGVDTLLGLLISRVSGIYALGFATSFLALAMALEGLVLVAKARHQALVDSLPEICENISAAISSGSTLDSALQDLTRVGPKSLRRSLALMGQLLERGVPTTTALRWLKVELGDSNSDQLVELLVSTANNGGFGLSANLQRLSQQMRQEAALAAEIAAKQGWVLGTAKLALATPWAVVWLLSRQQSNALAYNSQAGVVLLACGLVICLIAYLLIAAFGALPKRRRVFAL